jgi:putative component of membrane protein insertase Oxa1/YidC/SpoIIIJ protein YidD
MKQCALFLIIYTESFLRYRQMQILSSCSAYAYDAIEKFGFFKGCFLAFKRLLKCLLFTGTVLIGAGKIKM